MPWEERNKPCDGAKEMSVYLPLSATEVQHIINQCDGDIDKADKIINLSLKLCIPVGTILSVLKEMQ